MFEIGAPEVFTAKPQLASFTRESWFSSKIIEVWGIINTYIISHRSIFNLLFVKYDMRIFDGR